MKNSLFAAQGLVVVELGIDFAVSVESSIAVKLARVKSVNINQESMRTK